MRQCVDCATPQQCAAVGFDCGHDDTERAPAPKPTAITVYGREECVQCEYTCKFLADNEIDFTYVDVDHPPADLPPRMPLQLPYVVTGNGSWSGYKRDRLKTLAVTYGKP